MSDTRRDRAGRAATRRGARHPSLVTEEIKALLEAGGESANHMEQIAMDRQALFAHAFPHAAGRAHALSGLKLVASMRQGGRLLWDASGREAWIEAGGSASDTVRGWGAMAVSAAGLALQEELKAIRPFADDPHFAVREWAWLALRPAVIRQPTLAIDLLECWAFDPSPRLRRFASEATRPRGVWSAHVEALKAAPWMAESLLEALRCDSARYVQNSVGNWLNDAARTQPGWVVALTERWSLEAGAATDYVCRRGCRSMASMD